MFIIVASPHVVHSPLKANLDVSVSHVILRVSTRGCSPLWSVGKGKASSGKTGRNDRRTREADSRGKMKSFTSPTDPKTSTLREGEDSNIGMLFLNVKKRRQTGFKCIKRLFQPVTLVLFGV